MHKHLLFFFLSVALWIVGYVPAVQAEEIDAIMRVKNPIKQVEACLTSPKNDGRDTLSLKKSLAPLLAYANKTKNIPLKWAYYIRMAEGYSIIADDTNPISDYYFHLAHELVKKSSYIELQMAGLIRQGYYHYGYRKIVEAFPYFLGADALKAKINLTQVPLIIDHYQFIAGFYHYIGDAQKAIEYLEDAVPYAASGTRKRINLINSIGIYYKALYKNKESISYFNKALKEAQANKDSVWIGIISGNIAEYKWKEGNKKAAIELLKQDIELSLRFNETHNAMRASLLLANYYITLKEWQQAKLRIRQAEELMEEKPYYLQYKKDAAEYLAKIAKGENNTQTELKYLQQYIKLRDSLEARVDLVQMQKIIWQSERDKYAQAMQQVKDKQAESTRFLLYCLFCGGLICCIIILLINKSKTRIKIKNALLEKEQQAVIYEKQLLDQEVNILKNSLEEFTNTIKQNEHQITQLRNAIAQSTDNSSTLIQETTAQLNNILHSHIMTDERWIKFKMLFDKVYPGYLQQMKDDFERITENDLKIIALQKLDLSNVAMSEILCISVEGIKKAKQRLKKKMDQSISI